MLKRLKNRIARQRISKLRGKHFPKKVKSLRSVGLIVDADIFEDPAHTKTLIDALTQEAEKLQVIAVNASKVDFAIRDVLSFKEKEMNWQGKFASSGEAYKFQHLHYEVLINYFVEASPRTVLLSMGTKANLKVGLAVEEVGINDFNIAVNPNEIHKFVGAIKTYLPKLNQ